MRRWMGVWAAGLFLALGGCAAEGPLHPATGRQFSAYTLEIGWTPSLHRIGNTNHTDTLTVPAQTLYLWAFRGSIPQDLQKTGESADDWRDRGCRSYGPVHFPPVVLSPALRKDILALTPEETDKLLSWDYQVRAACLGFAEEDFFEEAARTYTAFSNSPAAAILRGNAGKTVRRDALIRDLAASLGSRRSEAIRLRCATDQTSGKAVFDRVYIGIRARRLALFPAASSLADEPPTSAPCPESFLIPAP
ncbi:hypothetical protein [Gluconobacter sp. DsW_056]|uniref:hypothetical protein n=1 Tax=Gluconobacter sp. DsW_056 TaxID=1511209 RepID=UPI00117B4B51|nr:hypothetical protein [Gluconobacter sp. DsW_056]